MDDRHIEIEPYEEIVDRAEVYSTPSGSRSASPVSVDRNLPPAQSLSQGPSTSVYNANLMTSVMRPDPRYELAWVPQVPLTQTEYPDTSAVAVTGRAIFVVADQQKVVHDLSNGAIFKDLEQPLTQFSWSCYSLTLNISAHLQHFPILRYINVLNNNNNNNNLING